MSEQHRLPESSRYAATRLGGFDEATVGEMSRLFGLTRRAIRFYEEYGLLNPQRDQNNIRKFDQQDRARLMTIRLLRRGGLKLEEIAAVLDGDASERGRLAASFLAAHIEVRERDLTTVREVLDQVRRAVDL